MPAYAHRQVSDCRRTRIARSLTAGVRASPVRVSGARHGTDLRVQISDQGVGLPAEFDIDQPRASLGFKVIKSLLAQLEGRIAVTSNSPKGVMVQLDVPLDDKTG